MHNKVLRGIIVIILTGLAVPAQAQILAENFDYAAGPLTNLNEGANVSGGAWVTFSGTGNALMVVDGNLSFAGYPGSGLGRMVQTVATSSSAEDAYTPFSPLTTGTTTFVSFLFNLDNTTGLAADTSKPGDYFAALLPGNSTSAYVGRVSIRKGSPATMFQLGVRATTSNPSAAWYATALHPGETYLVVLGYQIISGNTNDVASLWVNPEPGPIMPPATVSQTSTNSTDPTENARFVIRQGSNTPSANIDGIRISDIWSETLLPVQLASFSALRVQESVQLTWTTLSELNNFGFFIERRGDAGPVFAEVPGAFVPGHGTTLEPRAYSFVDNAVSPGIWYYRLRQVDLDGTSTYSEAVKVYIVTSVQTNTPAGFSLGQNYPNPFNPSTTIDFMLPVPGFVTIQVYDLLGQEVASILRGAKPAGSHRATFDARNLPGGTYFYSLRAAGYADQKRMVILK